MIELENPLTEEYLELKHAVNGRRFPWFCSETSVGAQGNRFLLFSHPVVLRPLGGEDSKVVSQRVRRVMPVLSQIFEANKVNATNIYRVCFNVSLYHPHTTSDPHVDHEFPHQSLIIYLNPVSCGSTYVFKEKFSDEHPAGSYDAFDHHLVVDVESEPVEDKIVSFDGFNYHAQGFPAVGERRITLVATYG